MYDDKIMYSKVNENTAKLEDELEEDRRSRWEDRLKSESEVIIDDMTDRLLSPRSKDHNDDMIEESNESVLMDFVEIGIGTNSEICNENDDEKHVTKRKVGINSLCFDDFISKGIKMMENKNLEVTRKKKNERRKYVMRMTMKNM